MEAVSQSSDPYIDLPTDQARAAKWRKGREKYGSTFQGHPILELDEELLDAMNYVEEAERQGWPMADAGETLRELRESVRRMYLRR